MHSRTESEIINIIVNAVCEKIIKFNQLSNVIQDPYGSIALAFSSNHIMVGRSSRLLEDQNKWKNCRQQLRILTSKLSRLLDVTSDKHAMYIKKIHDALNQCDKNTLSNLTDLQKAVKFIDAEKKKNLCP